MTTRRPSVVLSEREASLVLSNWWRSIGMAGAGVSVWNELGERIMGPLMDADMANGGRGADSIAAAIRVRPEPGGRKR